ncbi:hypothetical protein DL764_000203 [Monosporascus ibericus]|uniref:Berberine/berberine-like domain-containing protein n=1 Tax=Monosporascus ibericus TaxID=155417 RepID=A0A4Q4TY40_9PEZI|nr:hypothetical protein DL764_000203 [Monosporascus ibericus]
MGAAVPADGSLVNGNAESHPGLFLALNGGGNNFGTPTSFTLSTYPPPKFRAESRGTLGKIHLWCTPPCSNTDETPKQPIPYDELLASPMLSGLASEMIGRVDKTSEAEASYVGYLFMNDADHEQDAIAAYGEENVGRLRDMQAKYDPGRMFRD